MSKKTRLRFINASIILATLLLFLSFLVGKDVFRNLDYNTLIRFQSLFGRWVDLPFSVLTLLGSSEVVLTVLLIIMVVLYWRKKHIFSGVSLIFIVYVLELAGKLLIYHPKPPVIFNRYALNIFFPSSFVVETSYSFPSGHMARITFLVIILGFLWFFFDKHKKNRIIFIVSSAIFIVLILVSRIYLAEHWLSDVLGGLLLGSTLATLAISFW